MFGYPNRTDKRKFHFIYKTTNTITGKFYVGMHSTDNIDDGYLGSGKRLWYSIEKYGKDNHNRQILEFCVDRKSLVIREKEIIDENFLRETLCMNLVLGGTGSFANASVVALSPLSRIRRKETLKRNNHQQGEKNSQYGKCWISHKTFKTKTVKNEQLQEFLDQGWVKGRNKFRTSIPIIKQPKKRTNDWAQTLEVKERRKKTMKQNNHQQGEKNSQYGKQFAYINKDGIRKKIPLNELQNYLNDSWIRGLGKNKNAI